MKKRMGNGHGSAMNKGKIKRYFKVERQGVGRPSKKRKKRR